MNPRHGEVWLADMGMVAKTRPTVILLADNLNAPRSLIIHIPITRQNRGSGLEVLLGHLPFLDPDSVANVQPRQPGCTRVGPRIPARNPLTSSISSAWGKIRTMVRYMPVGYPLYVPLSSRKVRLSGSCFDTTS